MPLPRSDSRDAFLDLLPKWGRSVREVRPIVDIDALYDKTLTLRARCTRAGVAFANDVDQFYPAFLASRRVSQSAWIPNSGSCWKSPGSLERAAYTPETAGRQPNGVYVGRAAAIMSATNLPI